MGDKSRIEWTEATWNPIVGCTRVSEGCRNCYAERLAATRLKDKPRYKGLATMTPSGPRWTGEVRAIREILDQPLRWRRPRMIFVNSMSDLFHERVSFDFVAAVFGVMAAAQHHTFQILTKRPERALRFFEAIDFIASQGFGTRSERLKYCRLRAERFGVEGLPIDVHANGADWPLPNVWIGVSVEDQRASDERIPYLLQIPAAVRFLSCEPLLGPLDLSTWLGVHRAWHGGWTENTGEVSQIDWVIVGSESGPHRRECDIEWVRSIRDQCIAAGIPFFLKQLHIDGKRVSSPTLDGEEWRQVPEVSAR